MNKVNTEKRANSKLRFLTKTAILSAAAVLVMLFEVPLPFAPSFYKLDFSESVILMGSFAMGPLAGVIIELLKNLIKALNFAIAADELPERKPYTSLAVNKLVYDMYDISVSSPTLCCKELLGYLNWSVFDDIRDTEKFQNIYLKAKEHCDK